MTICGTLSSKTQTKRQSFQYLAALLAPSHGTPVGNHCSTLWPRKISINLIGQKLLKKNDPWAWPIFFSAQTLTAIEMWLVACIGFLFFSLLELGFVMQAVKLLDRDEKEKKKKKAKYSLANAIFNRGKGKEVNGCSWCFDFDF